MERVCFILPLAFGLILLPYATMAINVKSMPPTSAKHGVGAQNSNPLIEKACASAKDKNLCIQTLKSQPGSANADVKTLGFMFLNVTKNYGGTVGDWIANKLEDPELGPQLEQSLVDCSEQYTDAIAQLDDSLVAYFSNALNDVILRTATAIANANTCAESLKNANVGDVMGDKNHVFSQYCSISLAIVDEVAKQKV